MNTTALALFHHPDNVELTGAGTLSVLKKTSWKIHIATMTPGDKESAVVITASPADYMENHEMYNLFTQHHSTFVVNDKDRFWVTGYPYEVKDLLSQSMKDKNHILKTEGMMVIE